MKKKSHQPVFPDVSHCESAQSSKIDSSRSCQVTSILLCSIDLMDRNGEFFFLRSNHVRQERTCHATYHKGWMGEFASQPWTVRPDNNKHGIHHLIDPSSEFTGSGWLPACHSIVPRGGGSVDDNWCAATRGSKHPCRSVAAKAGQVGYFLRQTRNRSSRQSELIPLIVHSPRINCPSSHDVRLEQTNGAVCGGRLLLRVGRLPFS